MVRLARTNLQQPAAKQVLSQRGLCLCQLVLILTAFCPATAWASEILVGGEEKGWATNHSFSDLFVKAGDVLVFGYEAKRYSVQQLDKPGGAFIEGVLGVAAQNEGDKSVAKFTVPQSQENFYFGCPSGDLCSAEMILAVHRVPGKGECSEECDESDCSGSKCSAFPEAGCERLSCGDCSVAFLISGAPVDCDPSEGAIETEDDAADGDESADDAYDTVGEDDDSSEDKDDSSDDSSDESSGDSDESAAGRGKPEGVQGGSAQAESAGEEEAGSSVEGGGVGGGVGGVSGKASTGAKASAGGEVSVEGSQEVAPPLEEPLQEPIQGVGAVGPAEMVAEGSKKIRHGPKGGCDPPVAYGNKMLVRCVSPTLSLKPGQVINTFLTFPNPFPDGQPIAIHNQTAHLIHDSDQTPSDPSEVYVHHFTSVDTLLVPPPTGQGRIFRNDFPGSYSIVVPRNHLASTSSRQVNIHLISTVGVHDVLTCIECRCPVKTVAEMNDHGGVICCRDCPSSSKAGSISYGLEFTTLYSVLDEKAEEGLVTPIQLARIDAAKGIGGRIEYEVPMDPTGALQIVEWDFTLNMLTPGQEVTGNVEGLRCAGHQHIGGACLELIDKATGELICNSCPEYGPPMGPTDMPLLYVVGMSEVELDPPRLVGADQELRIIAKYNATEQHTGVMSILFFYYSTGATMKAMAHEAAIQEGGDVDGAALKALTPQEFFAGFPSIQQNVAPMCQNQLYEIWRLCPPGTVASSREENAIVCCSMIGALSASGCVCGEVAHAEPELFEFLTAWQGACIKESLEGILEVLCSPKLAAASWSWANILSYVGLDTALDGLWLDPKYLLKIFTLVWQMMISIMASYFIVSWALGRFVPSYQQLPEDEKLIASVHAVYALVYAVQLLPYSVVVCQMIFGADFAGTAVRNFKLVLGVFISHGVMYVVEGCIRTAMRPNMLLLVHHIMFFFLTLMTISSKSVLVFKAVFIIDLFATYEFGLYAALLFRRLGAPIGRTRSAMGYGLGVYAVTRVIQIMMLWPLFVDGYGLLTTGRGWYWLLMFLVIFLVCIQKYTFYIYGMMWQGLRSGKNLARYSVEVIQLNQGSRGSSSGSLNLETANLLSKGRNGLTNGLPGKAN